MRWLVVLLLLGGVARADVYRNESYGFRFTVPDGYTKSDDPSVGRPIVGYKRGEPGTPPFSILGISSLGGTIGQEQFDATPIAKQVAAALGAKLASVTPRKLAWHTFALDGFIATLESDGKRLAFAAVQVPLKPFAIQITIMSSDGEAKVAGELVTVVDSLDGNTNWVTPVDEVAERNFGTYAAIGLGGLAALFIGVHFLTRKKR